MALAVEKFVHEEEETDTDSPLRYLPLTRLYSSTAPGISASGASMSKKVKARKLAEPFEFEDVEAVIGRKPPVLKVYQRRRKRQRLEAGCTSPAENGVGGGFDGVDDGRQSALVKMMRNVEKEVGMDESGANSRVLNGVLGWARDKREFGRPGKANCVKDFRRDKESSSALVKRWVELSCEDVDPNVFVGLACKVYWPLDDKWYSGSVTGYSPETEKHMVKYDDDDNESLTLSRERVKFYVSRKEIKCLNIKIGGSTGDREGAYYDELVALAASFDDCQDFEPGDTIWAKLTGHSVWPAIVIGESHVSACKGLKQPNGERSVPVQFFGTHDFARITSKQAIPFLRGLLSSFHTKCKQTRFHRGLEEARMYLSERKLPKKMRWVQNGFKVDEGGSDGNEVEEAVDSGENVSGDEKLPENICPIVFRDLHVIKLGNIVKDSPYFCNKHYIWPEGYTATRKYFSATDIRKVCFYKMEVLRNPQIKTRPLFRVTMDNGKQIDGPSPSSCWKKIYKKIKRNNPSNGFHSRGTEMDGTFKSGSYMFGFSIKKITKLIKGLPGAKLFLNSSSSDLFSQGNMDQLCGYQPVRVDWKDLDKCNVCHMDEKTEKGHMAATSYHNCR